MRQLGKRFLIGLAAVGFIFCGYALWFGAFWGFAIALVWIGAPLEAALAGAVVLSSLAGIFALAATWPM